MQRFVTGSRILWFLVACVALVVLFGPVVTTYFEQQDELQTEAAKVQEKKDSIAHLRETEQRLQDPAYVKRVARERLQMIAPGDRPVIVFNDTGKEKVDESIVGAPMAEDTMPEPTIPGETTAGAATAPTSTKTTKKPNTPKTTATKSKKPKATTTKNAKPTKKSTTRPTTKPTTKPKQTTKPKKTAKPTTTKTSRQAASRTNN